MKKIAVLLAAWLLASPIFTQNFEKPPAESPCGSDPFFQKQILNDPNFSKKVEQAEQQIIERRRTGEGLQQRGAADDYVFPVVFHIVHDGGTENLPDANILAALQKLNDAFAYAGDFPKQGPGTPLPFRFCLARRDPQGLPTGGITRAQSKLTNLVVSTDDDSLKKIDHWDANRYVNIWVVRSIEASPGGQAYAGYSTLAFSHGSPSDGIVVRASSLNSTTLAHEMGHFLGLYHTFSGSCQNDDCELNGDRVCDTPPDKATFSTCIFNSCSTDALAPAPNPFASDVLDFTQNFMDYTSCPRSQFTVGQGERMVLLSEVWRFSLFNSTACLEPCPLAISAGFAVPAGGLRVGEALFFENRSAFADQFEWFLDGKSIGTAADLNFVFQKTGWQFLRLNARRSDLSNCIADTATWLDVACNIVGGIEASATEISTGGSVVFKAATTAASDFEWTVNGQAAGGGSSFSRVFGAAGSYLVELTARNAYCFARFSVQIRVTDFCAPQAPEQWSYTLSNGQHEFFKIEQFKNGDFLLAGGNHLMRLRPDGTLVWGKAVKNISFGNSSKIFLLDDGGFFVQLGSTKKTGSQIARFDSMGIFKSGLTVERDSLGYNQLANFVALPDGTVYFVGRDTGLQVVFGKFLANGSLDWIKSVDYFQSVGSGRLQARSDGGCFLEIAKYASPSFRELLSLEPNGNLNWARRYDSSSDRLFIAEADGGVSMFYNKYASSNHRASLFRYDKNGQEIWKKSFIASGNFQFQSPKIARKTLDGGYLLGSNYTANGVLNQTITHLNAAGNFKKTLGFQAFESRGEIFDGIVDKNGGFVLAMNTDEPGFDNKFHLIHTNASGFAGGCFEQSLNLFSTSLVTPDFEPSTPVLKNYTGNFPFVADTVITTDFSVNYFSGCLQFPPCTENCDNGLDDDRDGLTDCFDPQCQCFQTATCSLDSISGGMAADIFWQSESDSIFTTFVPLVGNLDGWRGDTVPEIVLVEKFLSPNATDAVPKLTVFHGNGSNRTEPVHWEWFLTNSTFPAAHLGLGDLDRNGKPDVFWSDGNYFEVLSDFNPNSLNSPLEQVGRAWMYSIFGPKNYYQHPQAADFDGDGKTDILLGNRVLKTDPAIGQEKMLVRLGVPSDTTLPSGRLAFGSGKIYESAAPAVADLLTRQQCNGNPDCDGAEVAAGPMIFAVDATVFDGDKTQLVPRANLHQLAPAHTWHDGYTAIADLDHDGTPEVIVASRRNDEYGVYAWNRFGLVGFFPHPVNTSFSGGLPCVANVFDDRKAGFAVDQPEILATSRNRLTCFNLQKSKATPAEPFWWSVETADSLGILGVTAFDFNADGLSEPVLRDAKNLRVLFGDAAPLPAWVDTERNLLKFPAPCSPADEHPVVADVNGDGSAEIIFAAATSAANAKNRLGKLTILKSKGKPWANARQIWNQFGSQPTQVLDDLKVPATLTQHWRQFGTSHPFNSYNAQIGVLDKNFRPTVSAANVRATVDSVWCGSGKIIARLRLCNLGDRPAPDSLPIRIYSNDPLTTAASPVGAVRWLVGSIAAGGCRTLQIEIEGYPAVIYHGVAGDDGSLSLPFGSPENLDFARLADCDWSDNFFQFYHFWQTPPLDLGSDLTSCNATATVLDAGADFSKYRWSDGSADRFFTAAGPGKFWVAAADECGIEQSDTIFIFKNEVLNLDFISPTAGDTVVCAGAAVRLEVSGAANFSQFDWQPPVCQGCSTLVLVPASSQTFAVVGASGDCIAFDSVRVEVAAPPVLFAATAPATDSLADGSVAISVAGGFAPFNLVWNTVPPRFGQFLDSLAAGIYTVTATNSAGCTATLAVEIPKILDTRLPDWVSKFDLLPNPADGEFRVEVAFSKPVADCSFSVFDAAGRLVFESDFFEKNGSGGSFRVDCSAWAAGNYRVVLRSGGGRFLSRWVSVLR